MQHTQVLVSEKNPRAQRQKKKSTTTKLVHFVVLLHWIFCQNRLRTILEQV